MKLVPRKLHYTMMLVSMSAALAACGGGGGGSGGSGPVDKLPGGQDSVVLTWDAPVTREDESCLDDLAAYRVSYGLSPGNYEKTEVLSASDLKGFDTGKPTKCGNVMRYSYVVENLGTASWYFAVQAVDSAGKVSGYSNEAIKTVQ